MEKYLNRQHAGKILANELQLFTERNDVLVYALPRGGVPVAFEIAKALHVPLDVYIVRKLGVPGHSELAMGAIAMGDVQVLNDDIIAELDVTPAEIEAVVEKEKKELQRRELAYRGHHEFPLLKDKTIILVDDGIATGATMRVAIKSLRQLNPKGIVVAVPVADAAICDYMATLADQVICPMKPAHLQAVGLWYDDFSQTEDEEVFTLLNEAKQFSVNQ